ncbi:MAG: xanthine dehydrogenase family protein molybdopterin-binding subunit [Rhodobiaceae bacterium]|nr:xanthine dehydrogenase family protein molybdopterin-binding subunit [Rhodobiaceae bacterium]MCC0055480.1 xanthine dehydrogenase family protein molybdopterin-binding subunit [Rhodobiaceae bacterium]
MKFGIGAAAKRTEDRALTTGKGHYTSDVLPANGLRAVMVRSPVAHATFTISDEAIGDVEAMDGVHKVFTYRDVAHLGPIPCGFFVKNPDGETATVPDFTILQENTVRYVGDAIAMVVADTQMQARDAAEALMVDYDEKPAVVDVAEAVKPGAPQLYDQYKNNTDFDYIVGDEDEIADVFKKAEHVVTLDLINSRVVTNYMEIRSAIGEIDRKGRYVLTTGSQGVHSLRTTLSKSIFKEPPENFHIITPDVGGGFGTRFAIYREYPLVLQAAKILGRPVIWIADRTEHFLADYQGRDHVSHAEMALDGRGTILGIKVDTLANLGATVAGPGILVPALGSHMLPGCYHIPAIYSRVRGIFTNTVTISAYRGAGRPEAAYLIERLIDKAARDIGMKPETIRQRNFIKPSQMPYTTLMDRTYDSGDFAGHMKKAMEIADWKGFSARHRAARKNGKLRGLSMATYIEACSGGAAETAQVRLERDGSVTIIIGSQHNGQGHRTAFGQIAAEHLGVSLEQINLVQGDTDRVETGTGTGGSRSVPVGGASLNIAAGRLAETLRQRAGDMLEAAAGDIELEDGVARIVGTDREVSLADVAAAAIDAGAGGTLSEKDAWTPPHYTFPNGTHAVEVEIDPDTGHIDIVNYVVVDDFGMTLNPTLLLGQVHGGVAQGLGQAMLEKTYYDPDSGQLLTASFQDYCMPRAEDFPDIHFETRNIPCKTNALGMKGAGEAGTIGATPAVINAVVDALHRHNGLTHIDMPMTPESVWRAVNA